MNMTRVELPTEAKHCHKSKKNALTVPSFVCCHALKLQLNVFAEATATA